MMNPYTWDDYAVDYDALLVLQPYRELLHQVINSLAPAVGDFILDVGCGTGNCLELLQASGATLFGVDGSPAMLARAKDKCPEISLVQSDLNQTLPYDDATFSKVVSTNVLYALESPSFTLQEMQRVLKPGGTLVLVTPKTGYHNGRILQAHAADGSRDYEWDDPHASPEREELLIRRALESDETAIQKMLRVATQNRLIKREQNFHFFDLRALTELVERCGFLVQQSELAYANQGLCIIAERREFK